MGAQPPPPRPAPPRRLAAWLIALGLLAAPAGPLGAQDRPGAAPTDKFGLPLAPPATAPVDKFAADPAPAPTPPAQAAPAPAAPAPADEPEAVRRLRALLGPDIALRYAAAEVTDPAHGAVRLRGLVLERPDGRAMIEELTIDGLRDDGVEEAEARGIVVTGASAADGTLRIDRLRIAGLALRPPGASAAPEPLDLGALSLGALRVEGFRIDGETPLALGTLSIEDYGAGRATRVDLDGLELRRPPGTVDALGPVDRISLGRLAMRGLDIASLVAAIAAETAPPRQEGSWSLEAETLVLGGDGRPLGGLEALRVTGEVPATGPEAGRLALKGIRVEPFPGLAEWLERFGYQTLLGDLNLETRYERGSGRLEVTSLALAGREIGALGLTLILDGATPEAVQAQDLDGLRLVSFGLRYVDQSLYSRFVRQQARQTRQTEQQVRQLLANQAGTALAARGRDEAAIAPIRAALQRFLRGEARELEVTAKPPLPVPLLDLPGAMAGPAAAQRLLGLSATAR